MPDYCLLAVDTSGIQSFIFESNRLRENVGASELVHASTTSWAFKATKNAAPACNLRMNDQDELEIDPALHIEDGAIDAEVLYAGGGNFVALFKTEGVARKFSRLYSRRVLTDAPGLRVTVYFEPFSSKDVLSEAVRKLLSRLKESRGNRPVSAPLAGLAVTMMCRSTAMPAVDYTPVLDRRSDERPLPASSEIMAKHRQFKKANERLKGFLNPDDFEFPNDFDELGRSKGEVSYIAVVHADGNGVGKVVRSIGERFTENRPYIDAMRTFSQELNQASQNALHAVINRLINSIDYDRFEIPGVGRQPAIRVPIVDDRRLRLPFRPIVFGGDDVTFVCDGRLGIALAVEYIQRFEDYTRSLSYLPEGTSFLSACAGIAIVKSHYPFARAYTLAEELCKSAKGYRNSQDESGSALDWHFTTSGLYGGLDEMRNREFAVRHTIRKETLDNTMTLRPLLVEGNSPRTWMYVEQAIKQFQDDKWQAKRNKFKALRDALRSGRTMVNRFRLMYQVGDDELPFAAGFDAGWGFVETDKPKNNENKQMRSAWYDALELADLFNPVTPLYNQEEAQ